jgi:DNA mismatch endonuclease, patch repair protein
MVLAKHHAVVFVHGCFWHQHEGCRNAAMPKSNTAFWREKFSRNIARDAENTASLIRKGWRVCIVWECAIRQKGEEEVGTLVAHWLTGKDRFFEVD